MRGISWYPDGDTSGLRRPFCNIFAKVKSNTVGYAAGWMWFDDLWFSEENGYFPQQTCKLPEANQFVPIFVAQDVFKMCNRESRRPP